MSKITNDGLTRSGTGCFIRDNPYGNSGRRRVKSILVVRRLTHRDDNVAETVRSTGDEICHAVERRRLKELELDVRQIGVVVKPVDVHDNAMAVASERHSFASRRHRHVAIDSVVDLEVTGRSNLRHRTRHLAPVHHLE